MKKKITRALILLKLWVMRKFGYTLPSLRETQCVRPGELYDHFAYVVRAVEFNPSGANHGEETEETCLACDLRKKYIPCNFCHRMVNGGDICDKHRFEIICKNPYKI